jgi:hypothetical protein
MSPGSTNVRIPEASPDAPDRPFDPADIGLAADPSRAAVKSTQNLQFKIIPLLAAPPKSC